MRLVMSCAGGYLLLFSPFCCLLHFPSLPSAPFSQDSHFGESHVGELSWKSVWLFANLIYKLAVQAIQSRHFEESTLICACAGARALGKGNAFLMIEQLSWQLSPPESTTFPRASDHTNRHSQLSKHEGATLPAFSRTLFAVPKK